MIKKKLLKIPLFILMLLFSLHFSGIALAGDCAGVGGGIGTPTASGNFEYIDSWFPVFKYDTANPQTIAQNSSVTISVIGGFSPYTWSVSGTGFTFASETTKDLSNTLNADATA